jgi:flagellar biosynthesis/type III secretory pathway protein FliH
MQVLVIGGLVSLAVAAFFVIKRNTKNQNVATPNYQYQPPQAYSQGYPQGYPQGYNQGYNQVYNQGYPQGYHQQPAQPTQL